MKLNKQILIDAQVNDITPMELNTFLWYHKAAKYISIHEIKYCKMKTKDAFYQTWKRFCLVFEMYEGLLERKKPCRWLMFRFGAFENKECGRVLLLEPPPIYCLVSTNLNGLWWKEMSMAAHLLIFIYYSHTKISQPLNENGTKAVNKRKHS